MEAGLYVIDGEWQKIKKREQTEIKREADQFQPSPLMQKGCAALSTIFFQELQHKQIKSTYPYSSLCVCAHIWKCTCIFFCVCVCVLESVSFQPPPSMFGGFVCESGCVYAVSVSLCVWLICLWHKGMPFHAQVCEYLVRFDCRAPRRYVSQSLRGHVVITLFGECFFIRTTHVVTTGPRAKVERRHDRCI